METGSPITILDLNNGISTVATGPDNRFLEYAAAWTGGARHNYNTTAVSNVIIYAQPFLRAGIYGHGSPGFIITYSQTIHSIDQYFGIDNFARWRRQVVGLVGKVNMISLIGCKTGASAAGYNLLRSFADATDTPCSAPTSDVIAAKYNNGTYKVWIDPSGTWQTVFPGRESRVLEGRRLPVHIYPERRVTLVEPTTNERYTVQNIHSISIEYSPPGMLQRFTRTLKSDREILDFLQFARMDTPEKIEGVFAQILTGRITITLEKDHKLVELALEIYGDDKLVVPDTSTTFYRLDASFVSEFLVKDA